MSIIQVLVSYYERDKLRPYHDMISRFAQALEVSADELLGVKTLKNKNSETSLEVLRRLKYCRQRNRNHYLEQLTHSLRMRKKN